MAEGSATTSSPPGGTKFDLNRNFNDFLRITEHEKELLAVYRPLLLQGADAFVESFYDYLRHFPATSQFLDAYHKDGGHLFALAAKQSAHFHELLSGETHEASAHKLIHIGLTHYRHGIEPVWIMGAYRLYLDHLRLLICNCDTLAWEHRMVLESVVAKLLFRDMGLMLEGYWNAAMTQLQGEKNKVAALQEQVTDLLANLPQILWSVDIRENRLIYVSPSTREICPLEAEMPIPCLGWTHPDDEQTVRRAWREALDGRRVEVESRVRAPGDRERWFRRVFHPFKDAEGNVVRIDGLMDETTEARQNLDRLNVLATTDNLTGLPNRALFLDRLNQAIVTAKRDGGQQVVLMLMDLDHFKEINDTLGHPAGDAILRQVAHRLSGVLRESDTLARLGGDEFAVLLPEAEDGRAAGAKVADTLLKCFGEPFWYRDNELYLGAGIGISVFPEHGHTSDTLMSRADVAMYGAKHRDIPYCFYDPESDPHTHDRLQLATDLRHALERDELALYYQPQIDILSGEVVGVEALLRWNHPDRGVIQPDHFLPFAERTGLIHPITEWVLDTALAQCRLWRQAGYPLRVAVNVSARSFQERSIVPKLERAMADCNSCVRPEFLAIEITENTLMGDIESGARMLRQLEDLGVTIAVDDFGTGYSSLAYLKKLPIRSIKVDKSFVQNMASDESDAAIVKSTVDLAHNLGCEVVAEGVENAEVLELLTALGCDHAQGFHIGKPMEVSDFQAWMTSQTRVASRLAS